MGPGLFVSTSSRLERLLHALAETLAQAPPSPLALDTLIVPSLGIARWLKQGLAARFGIAASLAMPFPGAFVQDLERRLANGARPGFDAATLTFRIWRLLDDPELARPLALARDYVRDDPDRRKRLQLCSRLARCFDDYQIYRPDLLTRWTAGEDTADAGPHATWQGELWRALRRDAGLGTAEPAPEPTRRRGKKRAEPTGPLLFPMAPEPAPAPMSDEPHRFARLLHALQDPATAASLLPPRLFVFGAGTLAPALLDLLVACAAHIDVHLLVPVPSGQFSDDVHRRDREHNPLFARLGGQAREFARLLHAPLERLGTGVDDLDLVEEPLPANARVLQHLQRDIAELRTRGAERGADEAPVVFADDDASLRVHVCHSPQRELEVVRDQILDAFRTDRTLQPHDVLVLVPDIERYAPYAQAVFGPVAEHLPFHVADKSPATDLPLCAALLAVFDLAQQRLQVHDVLHLLENPAVQARFRLRTGDLPALRARCERAGIRWGYDGASRALQFQVPPFEENSWHAGLERLLFGIATGPLDELVAGVLPVADTTSGRDELLARFLDFVHTLFAQPRGLQQPQPATQWALRIEELLVALFQPVDGDDERAAGLLRSACADLRRLTEQARLREVLPRVVVQDWLVDALRQKPSQRGFLAGAVTVAAMLPMRTVPVRQLYVCGMDDASFPRRDRPSPFDLIAANRRPGDRSARLDDRQLFLDTLLAARERLHITYVGRSQKDDSVCAPSVVLTELIEHVERSTTTGVPKLDVRERLVVQHPLQPWSHRYRTGDKRLFTYGRPEADALPPQDAEPAWCAAPLAKPRGWLSGDLPLEQLLLFWHNPSRYFLREVLEVYVSRDDEAEPLTEPFKVDNLDRWRLQSDRVQRAERGEPPPRDPEASMRATGLLPVGGLGSLAFLDVDDETQQFLRGLQPYGALRAFPIDVDVGERRVYGEIPGFNGTEFVHARIAKLKTKDRLRAFVRHVFAHLAHFAQSANGPGFRTVVIGKDATSVLTPLTAAQAKAMALDLLDGFRQGHHEPLPVFERATPEYAKRLGQGLRDPDAALRAARKQYEPQHSTPFPDRDLEDADVAQCWRGRDPLTDPRFVSWAERLWSPLLGLETQP